MNTDNTISVTLVSNVDLTQSAASAVTLTGLVDTATDDTAAMAISYPSGAPQVFGSSAVWTSRLSNPDIAERIGKLVLTVASGMAMSANTVYSFAFTIKNFNHPIQHVTADSGQGAAAVMVSGSGSEKIWPMLVESDASRYPCTVTTSLAQAIESSSTQLTVTSDDAAMKAGRLLVVNDEVMDIVSVAGAVVTVLRGSAGSIAVQHQGGAPVCLVQAGGKTGYARPLALWKKGIVLARLGQSTPLPLATNTITVTMVTNMDIDNSCLLYTSPSPRDKRQSRMPSSA